MCAAYLPIQLIAIAYFHVWPAWLYDIFGTILYATFAWIYMHTCNIANYKYQKMEKRELRFDLTDEHLRGRYKKV